MGCSPSKGNVVHPIPNLSSSKINGSLQGDCYVIEWNNILLWMLGDVIKVSNVFYTENSSNDKHCTAEGAKMLDDPSSNQNNHNEQNQTIKSKELVSI